MIYRLIKFLFALAIILNVPASANLPGTIPFVSDTAVACSTPDVVTQTTSSAVSTATPSVSLPASIVSGNLLLIFVQSDGNVTWTTPSGWTTILGTASRVAGYYRVANGSEGSSVTVTQSGANPSAHASVQVNCYAASSFIEAGTLVTSSVDPPSITPSWAPTNTLIVTMASQYSATADFSAGPSGYSNFQHTYNGFSSAMASATKQIIPGATENPGAFTPGTACGNCRTQTIAIKGP